MENSEKKAIRFLLKLLNKHINEEEIQKIFENDESTLNNIKNRVPENNLNEQDIPSNNQQINDLNDTIKSLRNDLKYYRKQYEQMINRENPKPNKVSDLQNEINQYEIKLTNLTKLNKQLLEINRKKLDSQINDQYQLQGIAKEIGNNLLRNEITQLQENSLKIEENYEQFKSKIQKVNKDRDQIIRNVGEILTDFEQNQNQTRNVLRSNQRDQLQNDEKKLQDILDKIKACQQSIKQMVKELTLFEEEINLSLENENIQNFNIIQQLRKKLNGNRQCFIYFQTVFDEVAKMFNLFQDINAKQKKKNDDLQKELENIIKEDNEIKEKIQTQMNQLEENNQKEQSILDFTNQFQQNDSFNVLNQYAELYYQFYNQINLEIQILSKIILTLFPIENGNINQVNPQSVQDIQSFINLQLNNNSSEQQQQRCNDLFKKIYQQISNNSIVNQYIKRSYDKIQQIQNQISKFGNDVEKIQRNARVNQQNNQ